MDAIALAGCDPETALRAVERACGVTITVRDLAGRLVDADGEPLVDPARNSHRRQAVCARGFAAACPAHCRTAMNAACAAATAPFAHTCWKGVREVVVPLRQGRTLVGYLFAGAWRGEGGADGAWRGERAALPEWDAAAAARVAALLAVLAAGLLAGAGRGGAPAPDAATALRRRIRARIADAHPRQALARDLGLSPSRTSHVVRQRCGASLQQVLMAERLAAAKRLLAAGELTVAAVGAAVGWGDPPHFARIFRRLAGTSPGAWRDAHRLA